MIKNGVTDAFIKYVKTDQPLNHLEESDSNSINSDLTSTENNLYFGTFRDIEFDKSFLAVFLDNEEIKCWNELLCKEKASNDVMKMLR